ncbi:hypothetical protein C9374_004512 [Naegleria lovaniensis]|uniref:Acid ceramidase N-terminal domain-containing protein n=1 Tax=Naegleria lovaniensis TaxID=51637 RepID=A0AA88GSA0_NAELO|nr:uncharacterized protein C9374_004512 [Naegleria lovaniensis]KAG2383175.1 hypothetical protein C9374_004512 [Naegleria lovaniensis]
MSSSISDENEAQNMEILNHPLIVEHNGQQESNHHNKNSNLNNSCEASVSNHDITKLNKSETEILIALNEHSDRLPNEKQSSQHEEVTFSHPLTSNLKLVEDHPITTVDGHDFYEVDLGKAMAVEDHNLQPSVAQSIENDDQHKILEKNENTSKVHSFSTIVDHPLSQPLSKNNDDEHDSNKPQQKTSQPHQKENQTLPSPQSANSIFVSSFKATPRYTVDLDIEPRERWKHIVHDFMRPLKLLSQYLDSIFSEEGEFAPSMTDIISQIHTPYFLEEEMWGIADITKSIGLRYDLIFQFNVSYKHFCLESSVAFEEYGYNGIFQMRHMNFEEKLASILRHLVIDVDFIRSGRLVFRTTTMLPLVGISNGLRNSSKKQSGTLDNSQYFDCGSYSLSLIQRITNDGLIGDIASWFSTIMSFWPIDFLIRHVIQEFENFKEALNELKNSYTTTPFYLLMCSTDNSVLLTRGRTTQEKTLLLHQSSSLLTETIELEEQAQRRFIVQCETDWFCEDEKLIAKDVRKQQLTDFLYKNSPKRRQPRDPSPKHEPELPSNLHLVEYSLRCLCKPYILTPGTLYQQVINASDGPLFFSRIYIAPSTTSTPPSSSRN